METLIKFVKIQENQPYSTYSGTGGKCHQKNLFFFSRIFCFDIQAEALLSQLVQDQFYFMPSPAALWKLDANFSTFCPHARTNPLSPHQREMRLSRILQNSARLN